MRATRGFLRMTAAATTLVAVLSAAHDVATAGDAPRAVDVIENDLVADDPAVRAKAAAELTDRFPDGAVAVPMLVDLLDDESPEVVAAAARAIDSMTVTGAGTLAAWCADPAHFEPMTALLQSLRGIRAPTPDLLVLSSKGEPKDATSLVCGGLLDLRDGATLHIAFTRRDGTDPRIAFTRLAALVRGGAVERRALAAATLSVMAEDVVIARGAPPSDAKGRDAAVKAALALVATDREVLAWAGIRLLHRLRPKDPAAIAALAGALTRTFAVKAPDRIESDVSVCFALAAIGTPAVGATAALSAYAEKFAVGPALRALLRIGSETETRAILAKDLKYPLAAAEALVNERRTDSALRLLVDALPKEPAEALPLIADLGPAAASVLPTLRPHLVWKRNPWDAIQVADAVLAIAPNDPEALKFLTDETSKPDAGDGFQDRAWAVLLRRGPPTSAVLEKFRSGIVDVLAQAKKYGIHRLGIVGPIARFGSAAKPLMPDLLALAKAADDERAKETPTTYKSQARDDLALLFGRIGPDAATAVPTLEAWKSKGDEAVRVPAAQALRRIRAKK